MAQSRCMQGVNEGRVLSADGGDRPGSFWSSIFIMTAPKKVLFAQPDGTGASAI